MKNRKKIISFMLIVIIMFTLLPISIEATSKVKINKTQVTICVGSSTKLKVTGTSKKVSWTSGNKKIATVNKKGKVTGKKVGKTTITAKISKKKYTCKVTVVQNSSEASEQNNYLCFRNSELLNEHYQKHGVEMGFSSAEEYEKAAAEVVLNTNALHKKEAEDGDDVYYIESTNEFVIVSTDGYIRTYFYPNDGIDYYNRQ